MEAGTDAWLGEPRLTWAVVVAFSTLFFSFRSGRCFLVLPVGGSEDSWCKTELMMDTNQMGQAIVICGEGTTNAVAMAPRGNGA